ncbi:hypothetical protein BW721_06085 [Jeotgalibaca sp. PTS2502]|uniref:hypothetical protein n=1 Tax=Jeotgalibaca sp. PTS2502 TaxID=1903686 RepID=UPI0009739D4B|nr:hypothetical protein [Jeotgalibaca sp. PTS2502]APZ49282.1 hypothetical protein BW721_06085 [Jeotgalibaca sp. PTS2502]
MVLLDDGDMAVDLGMEYETLLLQLGALSRKLALAKETHDEQQSALDGAISQLEKKAATLEKMEKESFSNSVMKILGTYEQRYHRESEEKISAKLEFDKAYVLKINAHRYLGDLEEDILEKKNRLRDVKEQLLRRNPELLNIVSEREQKMIQLKHDYTQTVEAEEAANQLLDAISDILTTVDSSDTINNWEMITEIDILLSVVDRHQLDVAEAMIIDLERKVHSLVRELKDLDYIYDSQYQTLTECRPVINDFFSGLFSEWSTKHIIEKNLELLASLQKNVQHILSILLERKHELEHDFLSFSKAE